MPPRSGIQSTTMTRFDRLTHQSGGPHDLSESRIVPRATPRASFGFLTHEIARVRSRSSLLFNQMTAMIRQRRRTNRLLQRSILSSRVKVPIFDLRRRQTMSTLPMSAVLTRRLETTIASSSSQRRDVHQRRSGAALARTRASAAPSSGAGAPRQSALAVAYPDRERNRRANRILFSGKLGLHAAAREWSKACVSRFPDRCTACDTNTPIIRG